ncbi:MAG: hypothetical protein AB7S26_21090, partial [Sandaracinaceae bacterium]
GSRDSGLEHVVVVAAGLGEVLDRHALATMSRTSSRSAFARSRTTGAVRSRSKGVRFGDTPHARGCRGSRRR